MAVLCQSFLLLERPVSHVLDRKYTFSVWRILLATTRESTDVKLDQSSFVPKKICYTRLELCLNNNPSAGMDIMLHCSVMWKHCRDCLLHWILQCFLAVCPAERSLVTVTTGDFLVDKNTPDKSKINSVSYTSLHSGQCHTASWLTASDSAPMKIIFIRYCHSSNRKWSTASNRKYLGFVFPCEPFYKIYCYLSLPAFYSFCFFDSGKGFDPLYIHLDDIICNFRD